jgi:hypothetical protein
MVAAVLTNELLAVVAGTKAEEVSMPMLRRAGVVDNGRVAVINVAGLLKDKGAGPLLPAPGLIAASKMSFCAPSAKPHFGL